MNLRVILGSLGAIFIFVIFKSLYNLARNVRAAKASGLPYVVVPIDQRNLFWQIFTMSPRNRRWLDSVLPQFLRWRMRLTSLGWEHVDKTRPYEKGSTFLVVGLGQLDLWTAEPEVVNDVFRRIHDFMQPDEIAVSLGQYGENVLTANGDAWSRHRKIVSSVIDDRVAKSAFDQNVSLVDSVLEDVLSNTNANCSAETSQLFAKLKEVIIHVASGISGADDELIGLEKEETKKYVMTRVEALLVLVQNLVGFFILPVNVLRAWPEWAHGSDLARRVGIAKKETKERNEQLLSKAREMQLNDSEEDMTTSKNLLKKLLQVSDASKDEKQKFSDDELISNVWIFTIAGFETTATTLAYALLLLVRYPEWQKWLLQEIDDLTRDDPSTLDYSMFYKATRTLAFMQETLRLFPPAPHVKRFTKTPQVLQVNGESVQFEAGLRVQVSMMGVHLLPLWRDLNRGSDPEFVKGQEELVADEFVFRPSRWIDESSDGPKLHRPEKGTFVPFAAGPRVCVGQKIAQVNFTAALMALLRNHSIEATRQSGENDSDVNKRLDAHLEDSDWVTVLRMNGIFDQDHSLGITLQNRR